MDDLTLFILAVDTVVTDRWNYVDPDDPYHTVATLETSEFWRIVKAKICELRSTANEVLAVVVGDTRTDGKL